MYSLQVKDVPCNCTHKLDNIISKMNEENKAQSFERNWMLSICRL